MKMNDENYEDDFLMNESDEFLLNMTEQLKQELKHVQVSEHLIVKTLKAVENDEQNTNVKKDKITKASIMKYTKRYVGVAAAFFVLVIGYQLISLVGFGSISKSADNAESATTVSDANKQQEELYAPSLNESAEEPKESATMVTQEPEYAEDSINIQTTTEGVYDKVTGSTIENLAFTIALEATKVDTTDDTIIHTYQGDITQAQCTQLLVLFQSEALSLSSDEVTETWRNLFVLSTDNESAILYKVGKKEYVVAQVYDTAGLKSETVYHVSDMTKLHESIEEIMNQ